MKKKLYKLFYAMKKLLNWIQKSLSNSFFQDENLKLTPASAINLNSKRNCRIR
jgi:hypothetical protein